MVLAGGYAIRMARRQDQRSVRNKDPRLRHAWRSRARLTRSAERHFPPLCVLPIALAFGIVIAGDFGFVFDHLDQYRTGHFTVEYVLGESNKLLHGNFRYRGAAFEVALQAGERILGLTDDQHIFLSRYLLSHCVFLGGAFASYLLAYRLFQNRLLATFAMLFFLCHPRLYGHSFYNSKDGAFLSMFMIALVLAYGALRTGRIRSYAGLGLWIGLSGSIRPTAFLLVMLVPLAQCVDLVRGSARERMRLLLAAIVLALASAAAFFAALPYLWGVPFARFIEWLALMSNFPSRKSSLFLGELIATDDRPWSYIPVWFSVTTPPVVTALAILGGLVVGGRLVRDPAGALSGRAHAEHASGVCGFEALLVASALMPVVVVTFWVGNIADGWRHLYFVYGPVCLLACAGLAWLLQCNGKRFSALTVIVATFGLVPVIFWIAILHPHQNVYFNFLVDRKTPERLRTQFDMDYWAVSQKEAIETLLDLLPQGRVPIAGIMARSIRIMPAKQRSRIVHSEDFSAYFSSDYRSGRWGMKGVEKGGSKAYVRPVHVRKVFSSTLYAIARLHMDDIEGSSYQADYCSALATPPVGAGGRFRVHWDGEVVTYIGEDCTPVELEQCVFRIGWRCTLGRFFLHVVPRRHTTVALPGGGGGTPPRQYFQFRHRGVVFDEGRRRVCMARMPLHGHAVDAIHTGQLDSDGVPSWSVRLPIAASVALGGR